MSDLVEKIVKRDDIRAKTPEPLNEKVAYNIGIALANFLKRKGKTEVVIGYDMRLSSPGLAKALIESLFNEGFKVKEIGQCSTEMISFVSGDREMPAVMVTASHNPKEYNGFKILLPGARPIGKKALEEIVKEAEELSIAPEISGIEKSTLLTITDEYVEKLLSASNISQEGYKTKISVVIDAGNGMGAEVFKKIAPMINWVEPIYYYDNPDGDIPSGIMPNTIDPNYLKRLAREVAENRQALLGICFDGDADRAAFVYRPVRYGVQILTPSQVGGLIIKKLLDDKKRDRKILYTLPCSGLIPELIKKLGGIAVMCPVGYGQIRERVLKAENSDCSFALEHSGHYFYRDFYCADSGMITALIILDMVARLASKGENLFSIISPWQSRFFQSDEINFDFPIADLMQKQIDYFRKKLKVQPIEEYSSGDPINTKTILKEERPLENYPGRFWFCLRPSENEPKLRLIAEVILSREIPETERVKIGPEILAEKVNQLTNLVNKERSWK